MSSATPSSTTSSAILSDLPRRLIPGVTQALTPAYYDLLAKLGNPHLNMPPVFHVAGTNGKGSTCAFLRAILEAAGYKVHVYTSPHLVRYHERIRIAGELISEEELVALLSECKKYNTDNQISEFEIGTAVALAAFARHPADFTILETGLGGRLDATNVVPNPLATLITRLSYDHREFLGDTLAKIATEKAGIMRAGIPCFSSAQPDHESIDALLAAADSIKTTLLIGGDDWTVKPTNAGFHFHDKQRDLDLPAPALLGEHQFSNAGLAIAALSTLSKKITVEAIVEGLQKVEWPARLQHLKSGDLVHFLAQNQQLWLDGGHNDSAGEVLALQAKKWVEQDGNEPRPLCLIFGMLTTKNPEEFLQHLVPLVSAVRALAIPEEPSSFSASELSKKVLAVGVSNVNAASSLRQAISELAQSESNARILICGSLYLAGYVLRQNGTPK